MVGFANLAHMGALHFIIMFYYAKFYFKKGQNVGARDRKRIE